MALFRDLTRTIAEAEGISEMTVTGVGQYLRDAGLISKHGRGRAAAQMSVTDAANLIIGVNACDLAKNAATVVALYRPLSIHMAPLFRSSDLISHVLFDEKKDLGSCLELILECLSNGPQAYDLKKFLREKIAYIEIGFGRPVPSAYINISRESPPSPNNPFNSLDKNDLIGFAHYWNNNLWSQHNGQRELRIIGSAVLIAVSELISTQ